MRTRFSLRGALSLAACLFVVAVGFAGRPQPLRFSLTFAPAVSKEPFTGRVLVMLNQGAGEPRRGPDWFNPQPFFAMDVKDWKPGEALDFVDQFALPKPLRELPNGSWQVQAVMDFGREREIGRGVGNGYSQAQRLDLNPQASGVVPVTIDRVVQERPFRETDRVKLFEIESKLLSDFHKRPIKLRAGVALPESFGKDPARKYPIVYDVPGFGGTHQLVHIMGRGRTNLGGEEFLYVVLDPDCPLGHHVFADSANNGPCGKALTQELVPALEKKFNAVGKTEGRFVTGHSSGGWSSLWLQVAYPDVFGGCWSTAPDPVDFRDFQMINLYQPKANTFRDEAGKDRPLARQGDHVMLWWRPFSDMEEVMGHGGQLGSFEAVFSPKGTDGRPRRLWDRKSGAVDPETAKAWEPYDISLTLKRNWATLGPKVKGKLHVYCGDKDTFYLEGATRLLQATLKELGSDAVVELFPGKDHFNLMQGGLDGRISNEMAAQWRKAKDGKAANAERSNP